MNKNNLFKTQLKRVISLILIMIICLSFSFSATAFGKTAAPAIKLVAKEINSINRTVLVDVVIEKEAMVAASSFSITYDTSKVSFISSDINSNVSNNSGTLVSNDNGNGKVKFSYVTTAPISEQFVLTTIEFSVNEEYYGNIALDITDYDGVDYEGTPLDLDCTGIDIKYPFLNDVISTTNPFVDVKQGDYYYTPVLWAYQNKIAAGITNTAFDPNGSCTRGQVVSFLWRAVGRPSAGVYAVPFKDLAEDAYYEDAVLWAYDEGIVAGVTETEFRPDSPVTRAQFVTFLWRLNGKPSHTCENPFTDLPEGKYYTDAVLWAYENNIAAGMTSSTFEPERVCTRGHVVSFIYRAFQ